MDIQRPASKKKRNRRIAGIVAVAIGFGLLTAVAWSVSRRPPGVDGDQIFYGEVRSGEFVYEITAAGSLYAPEIRSVTNQSEGIVEQIYVLPGQAVESDDVLLELSSPSLQQDLADAQADLEAAEADEISRKAKQEVDGLKLESTLADATSNYEVKKLEADATTSLYKQKAAAEIEYQSKIRQADQAKRQVDAAQKQLDIFPETSKAADDAADAKLDQKRRKVERLQEKVDDLNVRAGFSGVVQEIDHEVGERMSAGGEVAKVVDPKLLIARVKVSERDAALVELGQPVRLEMGREMIAGKVTRIDPAVTDRLVTVDVDLVGKPTRQLRPDLTVTARIEIDRVPETLVLDKPAGLRDDADEADLFRVDDSGHQAQLVNVKLGRISAREVEILSGLHAGDKVILSNMSDWLDEPEIRIR